MNRQKRSNKLTFATQLSSLMSEKGITIREAALAAGVSPSTLMGWRTGSTPTDLLAVKRLASKLCVSTIWLLTGEHDDQVTTRPVDASSVGQQHFHEGEVFFDGYAKLIVQKLIPKART